jgi:elongation factor Ts
MSISSSEVKKFRDMTGASMMDCKRALESANGDMEKAQEFLAEQGIKIAEKKSSRELRAGLVEPYIHNNSMAGSMIEVLCETDFVARNPVFKELAHDLAMQVLAISPEDLSQLLASPFIKDESKTIEEYINSKIAILGENIKVGKFVRFQL